MHYFIQYEVSKSLLNDILLSEFQCLPSNRALKPNICAIIGPNPAQRHHIKSVLTKNTIITFKEFDWIIENLKFNVFHIYLSFEFFSINSPLLLNTKQCNTKVPFKSHLWTAIWIVLVKMKTHSVTSVPWHILEFFKQALLLLKIASRL